MMLSLLASAPLSPAWTQVLKPEPATGRQLAEKYCAACHLFPEPDLMDRATWKNGTRPFLTKRLGISQLNPQDPEQKVILDEWSTIWDYYLKTAPEIAPRPQTKAAIPVGLDAFEVWEPPYRPGKTFVTLTQIDPATRQIYVGNAQTLTLDVLSAEGKTQSSLSVESPPVSLSRRPDAWYLTLIGLVPPHNQRIGKLVQLRRSENEFRHVRDVLTELPRPTDTRFGDLDGDGLEDLVVSGFGNVLGQLTYHRNLGNGQYETRVLYDRPGAVATVLHDFDRDGRLDIAALMAQAQEGVFLLLNEGGNRFSEYPAVRAHPAWGYAGFEVVDFDGDGRHDILTANGDNGEYPSCLKPYHGIRLYRNLPQGFRQQFFFPLNGAFKALSADFDGDGDLDIAAISYFPDFAQTPEESFVLLWNQGNGQFKPETFPRSHRGRWLTMDVGDLDGDGDPDIVLGAANRTPYATEKSIEASWGSTSPPIVVLRNRSIRPDTEAKTPPK